MGTDGVVLGFSTRKICHFKIRKDLSFNECLVSEVLIGKRKVFFTVCYRSPRHVFNEFRCHSFTFMHSFFPDSIKSWNNIGSEFTSLSPISKFKEALLSLIGRAKKSVFAIHNPTGIKKLFQPRVGLTQLKSHRKKSQFS